MSPWSGIRDHVQVAIELVQVISMLEYRRCDTVKTLKRLSKLNTMLKEVFGERKVTGVVIRNQMVEVIT